MPNETLYSPALLVALFTFVAVSSITPGPNNIMLMVSGVNFGIRRTVPQMARIFSGLFVIVAATGLGLGYLFLQFPLLRVALMLAGILYTLYLAARIMLSGSIGGASLARPLTYGGSLLFQAVNPKLWAMAITAAAIYVRPHYLLADTALLVSAFSLVNIPAMLVWAGFGVGLRQALQAPGRVRAFNIVMGLLLAASVLAFLRN